MKKDTNPMIVDGKGLNVWSPGTQKQLRSSVDIFSISLNIYIFCIHDVIK